MIDSSEEFLKSLLSHEVEEEGMSVPQEPNVPSTVVGYYKAIKGWKPLVKNSSGPEPA